MRAFVSIDCDAIAEEIQAAQRPYRDVDGLRLVDPDDAPVTLKFLGDVPSERLPPLDEALSAHRERATAVDDGADAGEAIDGVVEGRLKRPGYLE
jgi:2'-5' RNA ligase